MITVSPSSRAVPKVTERGKRVKPQFAGRFFFLIEA